MLSLDNVSKAFGKQVLFDGASLAMTPGERLGLIARNGHGKSTLFRMILGEVPCDNGVVNMPRYYRVGHLAQHLNFTKPTLLEEACLGLLPEEEHDHYKAERILFGLGFTATDMHRPPHEFSGGFQIRLNLAKVLVSAPHLLLLDEPTNYLDIVSIRWITKFLRQWPNALILISHDREFMDSVTTHTAIIYRHKMRRVEGSTAKLYALIAQEEELYEKTRINQEKQRKHAETFITRFRAQANKASMVQSRVKMLDKLPQYDKLTTLQNLDFQFHAAPFASKISLEFSDLSFAFDPSVPLISKLSGTIYAKDRIAVIGKNGKGKFTLLNLLAGELQSANGTIKSHPHMQLGYFGQTNIDRLHTQATVEEEISQANLRLSRTQVRTICGIMMFSGDHAEKKIAYLSGGEESRVMLGKILAAPANLLFLDEPTNHLDMESIEALIEAIDAFDGASVIVTHSEAILRRVATKLIIFHHDGVEWFPGNYDEFLEKIGWDEFPGTKKPSVSTSATPIETTFHKKILRKKRADIITQRTKELNPVKTEVQALEEEIIRLETTLRETNAALITASQTNNVDTFVTLSKAVKNIQKRIESAFTHLEKRTHHLQKLTEKYDEWLRTSEK